MKFNFLESIENHWRRSQVSALSWEGKVWVGRVHIYPWKGLVGRGQTWYQPWLAESRPRTAAVLAFLALLDACVGLELAQEWSKLAPTRPQVDSNFALDGSQRTSPISLHSCPPEHCACARPSWPFWMPAWAPSWSPSRTQLGPKLVQLSPRMGSKNLTNRSTQLPSKTLCLRMSFLALLVLWGFPVVTDPQRPI